MYAGQPSYINNIKDVANYKDPALEIYLTIVYARPVQLYFDVIGYFGCLRVKLLTLKP